MKYKIYLYIILNVISVSIQTHLEIIENLKLKITTKEKKRLKQALELSKKLYEANPVENNNINKYAKTIEAEIINYHYMRKKAILVKTSIPYLAIDNKKLYPGSYKKDLTHLKQTITRIINLMERCLNLMYTGEDVA